MSEILTAHEVFGMVIIVGMRGFRYIARDHSADQKARGQAGAGFSSFSFSSDTRPGANRKRSFAQIRRFSGRVAVIKNGT